MRQCTTSHQQGSGSAYPENRRSARKSRARCAVSGKVIHVEEGGAVEHLEQLLRKPVRPGEDEASKQLLRVYTCGWCRTFHVGHVAADLVLSVVA